MNKSPKPKKKMTFPKAIEQVIAGKKITKLEWKNKDYGVLKDGFLMIRIKSKFFRWNINDGDLLGEDWIIVS